MLNIACGVIVCLVVVVALLACSQHKLIYFPRPYTADDRRVIEQWFEVVEYRTDEGAQTALYRGPADGGRPERLWLMFHGNGAQAQHWIDLFEYGTDPRAGFLAIDYPGYGYNEGKAWDHTIRESTLAAYSALRERLGVDVNETAPWEVGLIGYSIGGGAALQVAKELGARRIVLLAPFTSLRAVAARNVGWPINQLVRDDYDNLARLKELRDIEPPPRVVIFHGLEDRLIPLGHGRRLAAVEQAWIELIEVPGGDHNNLLWAAGDRIARTMKLPNEKFESGASK